MAQIQDKNLEIASFAAGCFWQVEEAFRHLKGVKETVVGYTGGHKDNPTYEKVCGGQTGHTEAVRVTYDPKEISYEKLLEIFWDSHDPTQLNRQGPDIGFQYRSAVFYHTPEQKKIAEESKKKIKGAVTEIVPAEKFWPAEEYHQQYLEKRGLATCGI